MSAVHQFDDNPCRPRHFRPPPCTPVVPDGPAKRALDGCRPRLAVTSAVFILAFAVLGLRLVQVTLLPGAITVPHIARFHPAPPPAPGRADIVDRNGRLLATTLDSPSLSANPRQIADAAEVTRELAAALPGLDRAELFAKLNSGKGFVWVKRHLTPDEEYAVNQLGIPGLQFEHEERRIYPYGNLVSHVVGYAGIDDNGLAGVERGLDDTAARPARAAAAVDRSAAAIHPARGAAARRRRFHREGRRRADHGRQYRRGPGDGVAAGFRSEPSRYARSDHPDDLRRRPHVQPRHARRLRDRLGIQDLHHRDGARFRRHHDDRHF